MSRCTNTTELEVHHKRRDGGIDLKNAEVLCQDCHENTDTYGKEGNPLKKEFSSITKMLAKKRANNQCECNRTTCNHH